MDLVIHLVSHDKNLNTLSHSSVSRTLDDLPSWAPDWSCEREDSLPRGRQPLQWRHDQCQGWYTASVNLEARATLKELNVLAVSGFVFDSVQLIGDELQSDDASYFRFTMRYPQSTVMEEWEAMALGMVEGNDPYFGQDGWFEAFRRTLIADFGNDGARTEAQMFDHLSWCKHPRLPPKESMALKVARSLGYIAVEDLQGQEAEPLMTRKMTLVRSV
jgi:hypothetical protein